MSSVIDDANFIINNTLNAVKPDEAVKKALKDFKKNNGKLVLIAIGKAAFDMARVARDELKDKIDIGIVITKYQHITGEIKGIECLEAGHPICDENSCLATKKAISLVENLTENDDVLFLVSGGGSALFELPLIDKTEYFDINKQLLASGANIVEINTIRKRLSSVKGGRFARLCAPAHIFSIVLSDIIGDPLDMIASGPCYPDSSTYEDALKIVDKYHLNLSQKARDSLKIETPKMLLKLETHITGSVNELCLNAKKFAKALGYTPFILTSTLSCEAREAGVFLGNIAQYHQDTKCSLAFIVGGETVVHLKGTGLGGRNQELALSATSFLKNCKDTIIFSVGSDGTDGPTDAAGGIVDETSFNLMQEKGIDPVAYLLNNDAYHALKGCNGLIITGPTGTNVNDLSVILIKRN